jgi:hypothetical protein
VRDRALRAGPARGGGGAADDGRGLGALPATLGVWISPDRAWFTVTPVGLSADGAPEVLKDDTDRPIRLRGVYNPDMAPGGRQ